MIGIAGVIGVGVDVVVTSHVVVMTTRRRRGVGGVRRP